MADVAREMLIQFLAHPDRDLLSVGLLIAGAVTVWVYKNVYWTPEHLGKWTRRAQGKFDFDDAAVKTLCSIAPFLADMVLSPIAILKGLRKRPGMEDKFRQMDQGITEYILGRSNSDQRTAELLKTLRQELTNLALGQVSLEEQTKVNAPLRMNELETEQARLENGLREAHVKLAELEEAYITCLDDSIQKAIDERLVEPPAMTLENPGAETPRALYEQMLKVDDDKTGGCFC